MWAIVCFPCFCTARPGLHHVPSALTCLPLCCRTRRQDPPLLSEIFNTSSARCWSSGKGRPQPRPATQLGALGQRGGSQAGLLAGQPCPATRPVQLPLLPITRLHA